MAVICKECDEEMEHKEKFGSKNQGVYRCKTCGNFVYEDSMEKKIGKTIEVI